MSDSKYNLKFEYFYRDEGNYKIFGELILANRNSFSLEEATEEIREKLIDGEFFYPADAGVPLLSAQKIICDTDWYEFDQLTETREEPTQKIDFVEFILGNRIISDQYAKANRPLIEIFEQKINDRKAKVWAEKSEEESPDLAAEPTGGYQNA